MCPHKNLVVRAPPALLGGRALTAHKLSVTPGHSRPIIHGPHREPCVHGCTRVLVLYMYAPVHKPISVYVILSVCYVYICDACR